MMTQADIDRKAAAQLKRLGVWLQRGRTLIEAKVADARAHAANAVTETLKATDDGRATTAKVRRHPSTVAAVARLDELWTDLTGSTSRSLDGLLRDAREDAYVQAMIDWREFIDESLWVSRNPYPTVPNIRSIRGLPIHGMDVWDEVGGRIGMAKRNLLAAVAMAGQRAATGRASTEILKTWERQSVAAIYATVRLAMSDGQVMADREAGRDLVHPDYLDDSPIEGV